MKTRALAAFLAASLVPTLAHACPVCFDANEANRTAFIATTVFLSLLPLTMIGAIVLWIRSHQDE
jgi:hypothetical protein